MVPAPRWPCEPRPAAAAAFALVHPSLARPPRVAASPSEDAAAPPGGCRSHINGRMHRNVHMLMSVQLLSGEKDKDILGKLTFRS